MQYIERGKVKMKIAIGGFSHETNTFALEQNDVLDAVISIEQDTIDTNFGKKTVWHEIQTILQHWNLLIQSYP